MKKNGTFLLMDSIEFSGWLTDFKANRVIKIIQNHHTYQPDHKGFNGKNHFTLLQGMENYHVKNCGYAAIAQNLTTFPDGMIAVCRNLNMIPAGIKGANQTGICIEHLGNFDSGKDIMTPEHHETILMLNALLCRKFNLIPDKNSVVYHHWYDLKTGKRTNGSGITKSCPGTAFFGGNTTESAELNFYPLITQKLTNLNNYTPAPIPLFTVEITANKLNVRAGAGIEFKILRSLNRGIIIPVYKTEGVWYCIHPTEKEFIHSKYVCNQ